MKQNIIVHFIIQKLKNKHTFLKNIQTKKTEKPLILTEREETKKHFRILNFSTWHQTILIISLLFALLELYLFCASSDMTSELSIINLVRVID